MIAHRALRQLKFQCTSADNNEEAHYATSPAFLLTNQTAFLHVKPEHLMTNSADKNKKPGPQRRDSSAACWQDWSICFCTCNILQQISIWGFATMSCWAMNSVESELYIFMCMSIYFFVIVCLLDISGLDRKCDAAEIKTTYRKSPVSRIWNSIPFSVKNSMFFRMLLLSFLFCDSLLSVLSYLDHSVWLRDSIHSCAYCRLALRMHPDKAHQNGMCTGLKCSDSV